MTGQTIVLALLLCVTGIGMIASIHSYAHPKDVASRSSLSVVVISTIVNLAMAVGYIYLAAN